MLPTAGGGKALLDMSDSVILLLHHQSWLFQTVKDISVAELCVNRTMLAKFGALPRRRSATGRMDRLCRRFTSPRTRLVRVSQGRSECLGRRRLRQSATNCRHDSLDAESDLRPRTLLNHDCAGHPGADQYTGWDVRQLNADRDSLCQSDPSECGIDGREELRAISIILIRDPSCDARHRALQGRRSVHEVNLDVGAGFDVGDFGFLEIRVDSIRIAVDQGHHRLPLRGKGALRKIEIGNETIDRRAHFSSLEIQGSGIARSNRLLVVGVCRFRLSARGVKVLDTNAAPEGQLQAPLVLFKQHLVLSVRRSERRFVTSIRPFDRSLFALGPASR